jgi:hypothetical protein
MKIVFLTVSAIVAIGAIGFLFFRRKKEVETNQPEIAPEAETSIPESKVVLEEPLNTEKVTETAEEMTKRLEKLSSADKDKPFAKMSKPQVSEVPSEMLSGKTDPILEGTEEPVKPKPKKKRPYKKKTAPKKTEE